MDSLILLRFYEILWYISLILADKSALLLCYFTWGCVGFLISSHCLEIFVPLVVIFRYDSIWLIMTHVWLCHTIFGKWLTLTHSDSDVAVLWLRMSHNCVFPFWHLYGCAMSQYDSWYCGTASWLYIPMLTSMTHIDLVWLIWAS